MEEKSVIVEIPKELENVKLPSPDLIQYYKNYNERRIFIDYDIDDSLIEASKQIMEYNIQDKGKSQKTERRLWCTCIVTEETFRQHIHL